MLTSYAQNFEDVVLWRALKHIERGFYIDIGAQDPVVDSVSLAFYEQGWRGVHVEPTPVYAAALRASRPDETVLEAAVGTSVGPIEFFEIPGTGISTGIAKIAQKHESSGFNNNVITVPCITLSTLLDTYAGRPIHWMKIDVEGMEESVLGSWRPSTVRPWIVVVEATIPLSQVLSFEAWEQTILELGYIFAYFDGLNRFYISRDRPELADKFLAPPNVFDHFELAGTANNYFSGRLNAMAAEARSEVVRLTERESELRNALSGAQQFELQLADAREQVRTQAQAGDRALALVREEQILNSSLIEVNRVQHAEAAASLAARELHWSRVLEVVNDSLSQLIASSARKEEALQAQARIGEDKASEMQTRMAVMTDELSRVESWRASVAQQLSATQTDLEAARTEQKNQSEKLVDLAQQNAELRISCAVSAERETAHEELKLVYSALLQSYEEARRSLVESARALLIAQSALDRAKQSVWSKLIELFFTSRRANAESAKKGTVPFENGPQTEAQSLAVPAKLSDDTLCQDEFDGKETIEMSATAPASKSNVAYLLALFDVDFVREAYRVLLGREADPGGFEHYVKEVRAGAERERIIVAIAESEEGRKTGYKIDGLSELAQRPRKSILGVVKDTLGGSNEALARRVRAIENRLASTASNVDSRFDRLDATLRRMEVAAERRFRQADILAPSSFNYDSNGGPPRTGNRADKHSRLESDLFDRLKSAAQKT